MLSMVLFIGGAFTFLIWNSYRTARRRWESDADESEQ